MEQAQGDFRHPLGPLTFLLGRIFSSRLIWGAILDARRQCFVLLLLYVIGYKGFSKDAAVMKESVLFAWISIPFQVLALIYWSW